MEDTHRSTKKLYLETLLLKRNIIHKIVEAVETKYLSALRNSITGQITPLVPTILNVMYNNYRRITPQQLDDKTTIVKSMTYDPAQPINLIFNSIENPVEYSLSAEAELTQSQTINVALVILQKQRIFKDEIRAWKHTTPAYNTW